MTHVSTSTAFARSSRDFFIAASHLLNYPSETPLPTLFMLGRSIELSLKSLLLAGGMKSSELSKTPFRHDLISTFGEVLRRKLIQPDILTPLEIGALELLSKEYDHTRLSYSDLSRPYHIPRIDLAESIAEKLLSACSSHP